jgi:tetratricopeptide (TPR) repeat protein
MWVLSSMPRNTITDSQAQSATSRQLVVGMALWLSLLSGCASTSNTQSESNEAAKPAAVAATAADTTKSTAASSANAALPNPVPPEAQQQFDKAIALLKAGQVAQATQQLHKLADAYPTFTGPLINLGLIELKANRYEPASAYFKQALQRDSKSAAANNYLGVCYRYLGKFKEAEAAYQQALAADDSYAIAHLNLGVLYDLYLQKPELALPQYERYQALLTTPDTKVAGYIKEITGRLNADKRKAAGGGASP